MRQMMDMMKNYKNRLFLANHGKRSVFMEEPVDFEDNSEVDDEMLNNVFYSNPNSFFFVPKKRGYGKRGALLVGRNPNGFNFPMGKRSADVDEKRAKFELDLDDEAGNFFGQRGKRSNDSEEDLTADY